MKVNALFFGTNDIARDVLEMLMKSEFLNITGVVTQPDRPVGRKQVMTPPEVKVLAEKIHGVNIYQPEKIRKSYKKILEAESPELIVVMSYGQILPKKLLLCPKYKSLNFHVSLLPELRGAVPMQMAILQGLEYTGVTLQQMVFELDAGPTVSQYDFKLKGDELVDDIQSKSLELIQKMINEDFPRYIKGEIELVEQDHSKATFCSISDLAKPNAEILFEQDIFLVERMVRAFAKWPVAWITIPDGEHRYKKLKVLKAVISESEVQNKSFRIAREGKSIYLHLQKGALELLRVQLEGKKVGGPEDYLFLGN